MAIQLLVFFDDFTEGLMAIGLGALAVFAISFLIVGCLVFFSFIIKQITKRGGSSASVSGLTPQKIAAITACINSYYDIIKVSEENETVEFTVKSIKRR